MGGEPGLPKIGQVRSMPARLLEIPVTSILLALLVSTHALAAEPPRPVASSAPIGATHYRNGAAGNVACT